MVSLAVMAKQFAVPAIYSSVIDDTAHFVNWTRQFADYFNEGIYYPRWMPGSFAGYGSPTFIFYQPLVVFISALFYSATHDPVVSVALIKLTGLFLSGIFLYFFMNGLYGWKAGLVAAISFMVLPYRVFDVYYGGLYTGQFACVWFAPILYYARKAALEESTGRNTLLLAFFYALLCVTHLFSAYLFAPVFFAFGLVSGGKGKVGRTALRLTAASVFAFLLDAFYLLPIITDRPLVHFEVLQGSWWSDYRQNFLYYLTGPAAVQNNPEFSYQVFRSILLSVLLGGVLYIGSALVTGVKKNKEKDFFISLLLFSIFMMTSLSSPLWAVIPGLKLLAFPARFAPLTILSASCLAGIAVKDIETLVSGQGKTAEEKRRCSLSFRQPLF